MGPAGPVGALAPAAPATTCALLLTIALWPAGQSRTCFPACPGLAATDVALLLPRGRASREETAPATAAPEVSRSEGLVVRAWQDEPPGKGGRPV